MATSLSDEEKLSGKSHFSGNCRSASSAVDSPRSSDSLRSPTTRRMVTSPSDEEKLIDGKTLVLVHSRVYLGISVQLATIQSESFKSSQARCKLLMPDGSTRYYLGWQLAFYALVECKLLFFQKHEHLAQWHSLRRPRCFALEIQALSQIFFKCVSTIGVSSQLSTARISSRARCSFPPTISPRRSLPCLRSR